LHVNVSEQRPRAVLTSSTFDGGGLVRVGS